MKFYLQDRNFKKLERLTEITEIETVAKSRSVLAAIFTRDTYNNKYIHGKYQK